MTPSNVEEELRVFRRDWESCIRRENVPQGFFRDQIATEFRDPAQLLEESNQRVKALIRFANEQVPYYRALFQEIRLDPQSSDIPLEKIPPLTKELLRSQSADLQAEKLPEGDVLGRESTTSGTTGQPVRVQMTTRATTHFAIAKHREYRWFRFDPSGTIAYIRPRNEILAHPPGPGEQTYRRGKWAFISLLFRTGPMIGLDHTLPFAEQVVWLAEKGPEYLVTESCNLECLALNINDQIDLPNLRGIVSVSTQLTDGMRQGAEKAFKLPIGQNYGLNEIGIVATRCPESGRYHVHPEHCHVEIVDENNRPCKPGEFGRILVTGLNSHAMPLIRYDTDDLAQVVEGPCPCGRTLPSFGKIIGRYRRIAGLPEGTWQLWEEFRLGLESLPAELVRGLSQFQLHQKESGKFLLRLATEPEYDDTELVEHLESLWKKTCGDSPRELVIESSSTIPRPPGTKLQNFTSDFVANMDLDGIPTIPKIMA